MVELKNNTGRAGRGIGLHKGLYMDTSHSAQSGMTRRQGSRRVSLAELRSQLERPSKIQDGHQQRLLELAQRLTRVQALGNDYARLELSEHVTHAMDRVVVTV